ncbi:MAG: hypothetical protein ACWGOV_08800 [Acidiferrobacterales bacterium]
MAAQAADVSVNGAVERDLYSDSTTAASLNGNDFGTSKLEFNVKGDQAFAKVAFDIRPSGFGGTTMPSREQFAGIKVGGVNISVGRLANAYNKGTKVDTMTANFLEARNNKGGVSKVPSFESGMLGVGGSAGDVSYQINYGVADTTNARLQAGVNFKAGPATIGLGYYSDSSGNGSYGISGKMKFGDIKVAAVFESADGQWLGSTGSTTGTSDNIIFADVSMPMGSGTLGLGLGTNNDQGQTFTRVSYVMKVGDASVIVGGRSADGDTRTGVGLKVAF